MGTARDSSVVARGHEAGRRIAASVASFIRGKDEVVELALVCILAEGHLLLDDVPGVGKTSIARALANSLGVSWSRLQFTPDLLPSDVTGVSIYHQHSQEFQFHPGPVFASVVLADEINRATPRTQAAAMNVALVRDPRERIRSAFRFQTKPSAGDPALTFEQFVGRMRNSTLSNYQTRQLSPQDHGGWEQRSGWQLRPELIDFQRDDLLIGVVEDFDLSMVVLEYMMERRGLAFDGAYASRQNQSVELEGLTGIPVDLVELDETLWCRARMELRTRAHAVPDLEARLEGFSERCLALAERPPLVTVRPPRDWIYATPKRPISEHRVIQ